MPTTPDNLHGWEPIPWDAPQPIADEQRRGFLVRAAKSIIWSRLDPAAFPAQGIFGHDRDWFISRDIDFFATFDGEHLLLIRNTYSGFPDPPEWGLASRPASPPASRLASGDGNPWTPWGHFESLPNGWWVPGEA